MPTKEERIQQLKELANNKPESRSKRMQVLVTPTMYDELKEYATKSGVSVNEIVNVALAEYMDGK